MPRDKVDATLFGRLCSTRRCVAATIGRAGRRHAMDERLIEAGLQDFNTSSWA
jgi:hypothetical protein